MAADDEPFRNLGFAEDAAVFASAYQHVRVLSEGWMAMRGFCSSCGAEPLAAFKAKVPVADLHCPVCAEDYELKAQRVLIRPGSSTQQHDAAAKAARLPWTAPA